MRLRFALTPILRRAFHSFGPVIGPARPLDLLFAALGSGLAILIFAGLGFGSGIDLARGYYLIAPMGASAVLLFAIPNSPLAQPWSVVVGNTLSALIAVGVLQVVHQPALAVGLSLGLSLGGMMLARALHPPGGAVALTAALNPHMVEAIGLHFVVVTVLAATLILVLAAILWHLASGRVYPFRQAQTAGLHGTRDKPPQERLGLETAELEQILIDFRQSANLGVEDLARLIAAAEQVAAGHHLGRLTCGEIMSRDLVTLAPDARAAQAAELFRKHGFSSIPVVGPDNLLIGVIFQLDLIRRARRDALRRNSSFAAAMALIRRDTSIAPLRATEVMTTDLAEVTAETPAAALLTLLSDGGAEAVPVMDGARIIGIVTRTDLISALSRSAARHSG